MKITGIIFVVIVALNMVAWIGDALEGTLESPLYYIFILILLVTGIWLIRTANKKQQSKH